MSALVAQSTVALSLAATAVSVFGMKRLLDRHKWSQERELSSADEAQLSFEVLPWRKQLCPTAVLLSKNQNAIGRRRSKSEDMPSGGADDQQLRNTSLPPNNYELESQLELRINSSNKQKEKTDLHPSQRSVTITRRSSKPSRNEPVKIATAHTRKCQRDRHATYHSHLQQSELYSLFVSSSNVECYNTDCQPSIFKASHQCRTLPSDQALEKRLQEDSESTQISPLMIAQHLKPITSYASLSNLSNMIDHEPNVSRIDSRTRSTSNLLLHKPSLFLVNVFNKMTDEQRSKSIAELSRLHEALTKSRSKINITDPNTENKLSRTESLPDLNKKFSKPHSITSFDMPLSSERTAASIEATQEDNKNRSVFSNEQRNVDRLDFEKKNRLTEAMVSDHIHLTTWSQNEQIDNQMIGANKGVTSAVDQTVRTPGIVESSQQQSASLPEADNSTNRDSGKIAFVSLFDQRPVRKVSQENLPTVSDGSVTMGKNAESSPVKIQLTPKPSSILVKSNKSNTNIAIKRMKSSRSAHFIDTHLHEELFSSKFKSYIPTKLATITSAKVISSLNSRGNPTSTNQESQHNNKSESITAIEDNENTVHGTPKKYDQQVSSLKNEQVLSSSVTKDEELSKKRTQPAEQNPNDKEENENSLDDVSSYLSQQRVGLPNSTSTNPTVKISNHASQEIEHRHDPMTTTSKPIPLAKIDEASLQSELSTSSELGQASKSGPNENNPTMESQSRLKKSTLPVTSSRTSDGKEVLDLDNDITLSESQRLQNDTITNGNTSIAIRTTTTTRTNLMIADDDDDEQSKLVNEQLKRSSLGLARDSLELLRNAASSFPAQVSSDERLIPRTSIDSTPRKRKSVLKSRLDSSDNLPTPELVSYVAIDELKGDKRSVEKQMKRRSLTVGGGTMISCTSPKPKRDSLLLLQERFSITSSPHTGVHHLSGSDSKHVEFIREPGDTITPVLNIGRGSKMKHPHSKQLSPSSSSDQLLLRHRREPNTVSAQSLDSSERPKSETSLTGKQRFDVGVGSHRPHSLDYASRHRSFSPKPQTPLTSSTSTSIVDAISADSTDDEKVCLDKSDYDEMVRLIMTPLSRHRKSISTRHSLESDLELRINRRLNSLLSLIITFLFILFYIFVFIKSELWHRYWHYPSVHSDENDDDEDGYY